MIKLQRECYRLQRRFDRCNEIIKALSEQGESTIVGTIMNRELIYLDANLPLEEAYQLIQQSKTSLMPVLQNNILIGTLDTENILEFIMIIDAQKNRK